MFRNRIGTNYYPALGALLGVALIGSIGLDAEPRTTAPKSAAAKSKSKRAASRTARAKNKLPDNRILRVQVLLDRVHFSPGEIDGNPGDNTTKALRAFQASRGLQPSGDADQATLAELEKVSESTPTLVPYKLTDADVQGPFVKIPSELMEQAALPALGFQSALEALSEKFHVNPKTLSQLNAGKEFSAAGIEIQVPNIRQDLPPPAEQVVVSKSKRTVEAFNGEKKVIAAYPATIGSVRDALPIGAWKITRVTRDPAFFYNPDLFWDANPKDAKAKIQPGPNNPSGIVWIGLTKPHYGIHGTPEPSLVGHAESHGCIRLTNWDASELGQIVKPGTVAILKE